MDHLQEVFGDESVILNVETIEVGIDFEQAIHKALNSCKVLLPIIGPHWVSIKDEAGNPRLFNNHDFIRIEISAALERNIRVIPVLVNGAKMPLASDLPDNLQGLIRRHAQELSSSRWKYDCKQLTDVLLKIIPAKQKAIPKPPSRPVIRPNTQKSWLAKNYLWILGISVALIIIGSIVNHDEIDSSLVDTSTEYVYNQRSQDEVNQQQDNKQSEPNYEQNIETAPPPTADFDYTAEVDYSGKWLLWQNGDRSGYFKINQNGHYFNFEFYYNNIKVGEGTGEFDGKEFYSTLFLMYNDNNIYNFSFGTNDGGESWEGATYANATFATAKLVRN